MPRNVTSHIFPWETSGEVAGQEIPSCFTENWDPKIILLIRIR
jgi:hypothetical protein